MIERSHLNILREIERCGSLTAAANSLHLTQSALSHTIKKLETYSGVILWTKQGRHIQLTQAGKYLLNESKRILPQLEKMDNVLNQFANKERGTLHIGMECHPCYHWLLNGVSAFLEEFPGVDIDVKQAFQFGGMAALFNHEIDILVTPDPIIRKGIQFTPVLDYEQVLVTSKQHPLALKDYVDAKDLSDETLYTYPVEVERLDIFNAFLLPAHCRPKRHKKIESTEIMLQLVSANRGVTTLPLWFANLFEKEFDISMIRLGKNGILKQIHLGLRTDEENNSLARSFLSLSKNNCLVD